MKKECIICGEQFESDVDWKTTCTDCYRKKKAQEVKDAKEVEIASKEADEKYNVVSIKNEYKQIDPRQLAIFKGQCLNIAAEWIRDSVNPHHPGSIKELFDLADKIYKAGIEREFI